MSLLHSLFNSNQDDPDSNGIVPLTVQDIPALRLHHHSRLREDEVWRNVQQLPGLSQWHPTSGEYVLATPWRHRDDIISLREISAFHHESALVAAVFAAAEARGIAACITAETYEQRRPIFYTRNGMELFETVFSYQHDRVSDFMDALSAPLQRFVPVMVGDTDLLAAITDIDHAAFDWLWRNTTDEFLWWMHQPMVEVWAGMIGDHVVSYYGTTLFTQLGHLDRIAIHPAWQGQGLGKETLLAVMQRFSRLGLSTAALTTQLGNAVSQHLYEGVGFRRKHSEDYHIYGTLFPAAPDEARDT